MDGMCLGLGVALPFVFVSPHLSPCAPLQKEKHILMQTTGKSGAVRTQFDLMSSLLDRLPAPPVVSPCRPRNKQTETLPAPSAKEILEQQGVLNHKKDKLLLVVPPAVSLPRLPYVSRNEYINHVFVRAVCVCLCLHLFAAISEAASVTAHRWRGWPH